MSNSDSALIDDNPNGVLRVHPQRHAPLRSVPDAIQDAYRSAWNEFYAWEPAHSAQLLRNLQVDLGVPSTVSSDDLVAHAGSERLGVDNSMDVDVDDDAVVPQPDYTQCFPTLSTSPVPLSADTVFADNTPSTDYAYPKYEACTPAARSIRHDDEEGAVLRFVPYADEGEMARSRYLHQFARPYKDLAWQTEWFDVDCE